MDKRIDKLTLKELRNVLISYNLDIEGSKPALVTRLKSYLASNPERIDDIPVKKIRKIDVDSLNENCSVEELRQFIVDRGGKIRAGSRKDDLLIQAKVYAQKDPIKVCSKVLHSKLFILKREKN